MKQFTNLFIIAALIYVSNDSLAQADSIKRLELNNVEVVKAFEATLEDAKIQEIKAPVPTQKAFNQKYEYDISIVPIELKYLAPQIKPLAMNPDGEFMVRKGYVRASYGSKINPAMRGGFHILKKDRYDIGMHIDGQSFDNSKITHLQKYNDGTLNVFGGFNVTDNMKLNAGIDVTGRTRYFYHTDLPIKDQYTEDQSKRIIYQRKLNAGISNIEDTKYRINYKINLAFQDISISQNDMVESGVLTKILFTKNIKDKHQVGLEINGDYHSLAALKKVTLSVFDFSPYTKLNFGRFSANIGLNGLISSNKTNLAIYPKAQISYEVWKSKLMAFVDIRQDNFVNNLYRISQINPYINDQIDSLVNSISREVSGGIKGDFGYFSYVAKGGFKNIQDQLFFLNDRTDLRKFDLLYDDIDVVFINGKVAFYLNDHISVGGWITQNIYAATTLEKTWHLPNTEVNAFAEYKGLNDKFKLKSEVYFGTKVDYVNKLGVLQQSNLLFDLNVAAQYDITDKFSVFANGDNLLNNRFERFYGYQSIGINLLGGIQWVF